MKIKRLFNPLSLLLSLVMCFSLSSYAFAAEPSPSESDVPVQLQSIEEVGISREEAMEALGLTAEEAKDVDFYAVQSQDQLVLNSGDAHTFDKFTFTDYNVGSYFTVNANQLKYGIIWELDASQHAATLRVSLEPYGEDPADSILITTGNESGYRRYTRQSDWISTYYGVDYHFIYESDAWAWDPASITSSVTMVVGVV